MHWFPVTMVAIISSVSGQGTSCSWLLAATHWTLRGILGQSRLRRTSLTYLSWSRVHSHTFHTSSEAHSSSKLSPSSTVTVSDITLTVIPLQTPRKRAQERRNLIIVLVVCSE